VIVTKRIKRYISLALHESTRSTHGRVSIGAVIVDGNYVVSRSANHIHTHPKQAALNAAEGLMYKGACLHAEVGALVNARRYDVQGCDIFVGRYDRRGNLADCKPCPACERGLRNSGISRCYFTNQDGVNKIEFV
jgi:deoxycytidylate deaminase